MAAAVHQLSARGRSVFELRENETWAEEPRLPPVARRFTVFQQRKVDFARLFFDLATLTDAGMTVTQAVRALRAGESVDVQRSVLGALLQDMSAGKSAQESFSTISGIGLDAVAMIGSGEKAGRLASVFNSLARDYSERTKQRSQMLEALGYPLFLFLFMLVAASVVTFVLVPAITPIFESSGQKMPAIVVGLTALREFLAGPFLTITLPLAALSLCSLLVQSWRKATARWMSAQWMRLPIIGGIMRRMGLARYLSSLSLLLGNGTPMADALALSADCSTIAAFRPRLRTARDLVLAGERLPDALAKSGVLETRIVSLIAVGDEASRLPTVLSRAAAILEDEARRRATHLVAMLTPTMIIALGLLIGGLAVSVMTALLGINEIAIQ